MRKQTGFTLIELVVVLVLLGILGAVATAQFQDLGTQAANAATEATAAEVSAGGAINFAMYTASAGADGIQVNDPAEDCDTYANNMLQTGLPAEIAVDPSPSTADCGTGSGTTATCNLLHTSGDTAAAFTVYCTN